MTRDTAWVWIPDADGSWVLAFTYVDPSAGPSAKGAVVRAPVTEEQIRHAVDHPDRTFRDPAGFNAVPVPAADALAFGLPKDPPWIGFFTGKPVPPPRGEPSRTVVAIVTWRGRPAEGARVRMGHCIGPARELLDLDARTCDAAGRCEFPLAPLTPIVAIAEMAGTSSKLVDVPETGEVILELAMTGALEGEVRKLGQLVAGSIAIIGRSGGVHRVKRTQSIGHYRIDGIVPDTYSVEVTGIDPRTKMTAGTPTFDEVAIGESQTVRRDYTLVAGASVRIAVAVTNNEESGHIVLFAGAVAPRTQTELTALWKSRDPSTFQSANSMSNNGHVLTTELSDVVPGPYTVCVARWDRHGTGHADQLVVCTPVVVADAPVTVEVDLPPLRPRSRLRIVSTAPSGTQPAVPLATRTRAQLSRRSSTVTSVPGGNPCASDAGAPELSAARITTPSITTASSL